MSKRIKIPEIRQPEAADTMKVFNISNHDWDTTPMKIRQLLTRLHHNQQDKKPPTETKATKNPYGLNGKKERPEE